MIHNLDTSKYVMNTWLLSQGLHPFLFALGLMWTGAGYGGWLFGLLVFLFGILFSLPFAALCFLLMDRIALLNLSVRSKFFLWLLAVGLNMLLACALIAFAFLRSQAWFGGIVMLCLPEFLAVVLASILLYPQFVKAIQYKNL